MPDTLPPLIIVEHYSNEEVEAGLEFHDNMALKSDADHPIEMRPLGENRQSWYEAGVVSGDPLQIDDYIERRGIVELVGDVEQSIKIVGHAQIAAGEFDEGQRIAAVFLSLFFQTESDAIAFRLVKDRFDYEEEDD